MNKKQSPLNRLRGSVIDLKGPFEPIEEDSWEALKPPKIRNNNGQQPPRGETSLRKSKSR